MKKKSFTTKDYKICVVGLGYVGLPLAFLLSKKFQVIGFDKNLNRINELKDGYDHTNEISSNELKLNKKITFTANKKDIQDTNIYIITVPTPITKQKKPDLRYLKSASNLVGDLLKTDDIVVYESTVYPGLTEEICIPILESKSNLKLNSGFSCGYSPERINPGDPVHTIDKIKKVISASNESALQILDFIYGSVVSAGTHLASSIKVAEAAKVIENTQRDLNIALINELSVIFHKLDIDTQEVLEAAETKWNFLPFRPGLVGGHCIGVDPYYLTYKANQAGYKPHVVLSGRKMNDSVSEFVSSQLKLEFSNSGRNIKKADVLIVGYTFKEDCNDFRNTKVFDIARNLKNHCHSLLIHDPYLDAVELENLTGLSFRNSIESMQFDALILAVPHSKLISKGLDYFKSLLKRDGIFFDIKGAFNKEDSDFRL